MLAFTRKEADWMLTIAYRLDASIHLIHPDAAFNLWLPLVDIYEGVHFDPADSP